MYLCKNACVRAAEFRYSADRRSAEDRYLELASQRRAAQTLSGGPLFGACFTAESRSEGNRLTAAELAKAPNHGTLKIFKRESNTFKQKTYKTHVCTKRKNTIDLFVCAEHI
jgi:hypothetical protein